MDSTFQNLLLDLKILSMVEPKGRLYLLHGVLAVEPDSFWVPFRRYLCSESRTRIYQRIQQRIMELENLLVQNLLTEPWVKDELRQLVEPVQQGLQNLKETYCDDSQMCAYLDLISSRFTHVVRTHLLNVSESAE